MIAGGGACGRGRDAAGVKRGVSGDTAA